jgi:hypothetical protein
VQIRESAIGGLLTLDSDTSAGVGDILRPAWNRRTARWKDARTVRFNRQWQQATG